MTRELDRNGLAGPIEDKPAPPNIFIPRPPHGHTTVNPLKTHTWNTNKLPWRVLSDLTAATCASGLVSPLITIIDRYTNILPTLNPPIPLPPQSFLTHTFQRDNRKCLQSLHPSYLHQQLHALPPHPSPRLHKLEASPPNLNPLLQHLRHSQHYRHNQQHSHQHPRQNHHDGPGQISRHDKRQHIPLPLQRQPIHPHVWPSAEHRGHGGEDGPKGQLRALRDARFPDHFRVVQPPAAHRALTADIGGGGTVGEQGQRCAVLGSGGCAVVQHAVAFVGAGFV